MQRSRVRVYIPCASLLDLEAANICDPIVILPSRRVDNRQVMAERGLEGRVGFGRFAYLCRRGSVPSCTAGRVRRRSKPVRRAEHRKGFHCKNETGWTGESARMTCANDLIPFYSLQSAERFRTRAGYQSLAVVFQMSRP
mmetsp:Transcript_11585/g.48200  ORF Transcript_11585/g.48200 Transcript_11585/m.48200 type:complete len:140 (-) Transcript_11585:97-516(-)